MGFSACATVTGSAAQIVANEITAASAVCRNFLSIYIISTKISELCFAYILNYTMLFQLLSMTQTLLLIDF